MKSTLAGITFCLLITSLIYSSCEVEEDVSDIPEIRFMDYTPGYVDTMGFVIPAGVLEFSFTDGDANVGIDPGESGADTANLYMIPYRKNADGTYDSIDFYTYGRWYRVLRDSEGRMDRVGQNKTIKGTISVSVYYFAPPPYDTIRYNFFITDRAGNKSNIESTSDIGFSR